MGSAIAMREGAPIVPGTPAGRGELRDELAALARALNVQARLEAYGNAMRLVRQREKGAHYYLLELNVATSELTVTGFRFKEVAEAEDKYKDVERLAQDSPEKDAVLVSVDSLSSLERAYPNCFADTRMFVQLLSQELSGVSKRISVPALDTTV